MIVYKELSSVEKDLGFSAKTLYGISNNISKHYHTVLVLKKDGTNRKLSVPDLILKKIQRSIADNILSQFSVSRYAMAYKPGASVQKNAKKHLNKQKILKLDIQGFFDNILYSQVKQMVFNAQKFGESIRILLSMLCYYNDSLPQGAPTSPAIINIIMYQFDENVGEFCKQRNVTYTRYCDDMIFSGDFDEKPVIQFVKHQLKQLGLFLKNKKTVVVPNTKRQIVTGIVVNQKANIAKQYKRKIRQEMFYIKKFGIDEHLKKLGISQKEKYLSSLKGRIAFVLQTVPDNKEFLRYKNYFFNK